MASSGEVKEDAMALSNGKAELFDVKRGSTGKKGRQLREGKKEKTKEIPGGCGCGGRVGVNGVGGELS
jgi:hypothetical protein